MCKRSKSLRASTTLLLSFVAMLFAAASASSQTCEVRDYPRNVKTLDNGLRVITVRTPVPNVVSLQIVVHTRPAAESVAATSGLAHVFEHMLGRGTAAYPAARYHDILRSANARHVAETSDDRTTFHTIFTKEDLDVILGAEADRFQNFAFSEADFLNQASAIQGEYQRTAESPVFRLFETQREQAFSAHPYEYGKFGSRRAAPLIAQFDAAKKFFDSWYRPQHTTVSVVGDIDPDTTMQLVERLFGGWPRGNTSAPPIAAHAEPKARVVEHVWSKEETPAWVTIAFHAPRYSDESREYSAIDLLLEAYFGPGSDLYRRLVIEEEKVELFGTDLPAAADAHLATVYARLKHKKDLLYVRDLMLATAAKAKRETLTADRLAAVKANRHFALLREMESTEGTAAALTPRLRSDDPFASVTRYACTRASLTATEVHAAAQKYFTDQRLVITTLSHAIRQLPLPDPPSLADAGREAVVSAASTTELPIVTKKTTSPLLEIKLVFAAGSGRDPLGKEGLAALSAAMIAEGHSATASPARDALYAAGGSLFAHVEKETATFTLRGHRDQWRRVLDAALPLIIDPSLDRADFLTLRNRQQQMVDRLVVDETNFTRELLQRRAFFATPYDHPAVGSDEGIATMTMRDVRTFLDTYYRRGNLTVGVSGDFSDSVITTLRERLNQLPAGMSPSKPVTPSSPIGLALDIFEDAGVERTTFAMGAPMAVTRSHEDYAALTIAALVFGDPQSPESRLHQRLIGARKLAALAAVRIEQTPTVRQRLNDPLNVRRASLFEINVGGVDPKNINMALRIALFELKKLIREGITEAEFTRARNIMMKEIALAEGDSSRWLGDEIDARFYGGTRWSDVRDALSRLDRATVNRAIREHLQATNLLVAMVAKDGRDVRLELRKPIPTPIKYDAEVSKSLLDEDAAIAAMPVDLEPEDVRFYTMTDLQEQGW